MNIQEIVNRSIEENKFIYGVFTTPKNKSDNPYKKITIRPINVKNKSIIQFEKFTDKQAFHENYSYEEANEEIIKLIIDGYKNINLFTSEADYQIIVSKKGSVKVTEKQPSKKQSTEEHNKKKQYIINENETCDFLELLGVMNKQGMVYSKKYDKFKQINKFLEIVDDSLKGRELKDDFDNRFRLRKSIPDLCSILLFLSFKASKG